MYSIIIVSNVSSFLETLYLFIYHANLSKSFNSGKLDNLGLIANSRCSERDMCARTSVKFEKFCKMLLHAQRSWRFPEIFPDFADFLPGQVKTFEKMVRTDRPGRDWGANSSELSADPAPTLLQSEDYLSH